MLHLRTLCCSLITAAATIPNLAYAQQADSEVAEIIVTAEKRSERLSDVPISVTAVSGEEMAREGVISPGDLEKIVPGFTYFESNYGSPIFTIRGIGVYDEAIADSPTVSVYVDQVPLSYSRMTEGAMLDIERVEALKGPQGTLFGQNSTGGAINFIAAKPTKEFKAGVDLTYGRFNEVDASAFVSGPLSKTLTARVAVKTEQRGDWQYSYTRDDTRGQRNLTTGRLLLDFRPVDTLTFELNVNGWKDRSDTQAAQNLVFAASTPGNTITVPGVPNAQQILENYPRAPANDRAADWVPGENFARDDSFYQVSLRGDLDITDRIVLTSISSYSNLSVDTPADNGVDLTTLTSVIVGGIKSTTQELRLAGSAFTNDALKWMFGGNYEHDSTRDAQNLFINGTTDYLGPYYWHDITNLSNQKVETKAVFGSLDYKIVDTLTVQASARYTEQERDFSGCLRDYGDGELATGFGYLSNLLNGNPTVPNPGDPSYIPPGGCATLDSVTNLPLSIVTNNRHENNVSWRTGLAWKAQPDTLLYANVTKGFKAGSFGTLPLIRPAQAALVPQESVLAYELGFKSAWLNRTLQLSGAAFYYDYKDKQLLGYVNTGAPFFSLPGLVSIPASKVEGGELDLRWQPITGLSIVAGTTYVFTEVTRNFLTTGPLGGDQVDIKGDPFPNTPKWQVQLGSDYVFPLRGNLSGFVGTNVSYRSATEAFFAGGEDFRLRGYTLVDLRTGIQSDKDSWRVEIFGHNVTDQYYWVHANRIEDNVTRTAGMPATFGIMASKRF
jgi:outer membrane receptor protein involved in Fe transport